MRDHEQREQAGFLNDSVSALVRSEETAAIQAMKVPPASVLSQSYKECVSWLSSKISNTG